MKIKIRGELAYRLLKNFVRLEEKDYRPETLFTSKGDGWPGDRIGRLILGLTQLSRITGREPAWLDMILDELVRHIPAYGYLGDTVTPGSHDEQQLSGHNWLVRGLIEYFVLTGDRRAEDLLHKIIKGLYYPLEGKDLYRNYPQDRSLRIGEAKASGVLQGVTASGWRLSGDVGCAFMSLDAMSQYYEVFGDKTIGALVEEMAGAFQKIDFVGASMQTHASLTAARGIFRFGKAKGDMDLIKAAADFFDLYCSKGMTANYANYNWFDRPYWTEPCAIVDSYLLAINLFTDSGNPRYLDTANRILYSGLGHAQRSNGGFGCDTCVKDDVPAIRAHSDGDYEAHWCCTMRGAEGLCSAAESAVMQREDAIWFTNYESGDWEFPGLRFTVKSAFPKEGSVDVTIIECKGKRTLAFYLPCESHNGKIVIRDNAISSSKGDNGVLYADIISPTSLHIEFPLDPVSRPLPNGKISYWRGWQMLGLRGSKDGTVQNAPDMTALVPIDDTVYRSRESVVNEETIVVFDAV
jgi:hypothetical protein